MNTQEQKIWNSLGSDLPYIIELRRYFHRHPELSEEEFLTQAKIEEELDRIGLSHTKCAKTGVVAEIKGLQGEGKRVLLRCDIDALPVEEKNDAPYASEYPGKMHACGHDAHTASLLGAARYLQAHREDFPGTIRLVFQPGEEMGYGGKAMVDEGVLEGVDRTFGLHMSSYTPVGKVVAMPGPNNASVDWFRITIKGKGAHVSTPEKGVDAVYIASQIVTQSQSLITRQTNPMETILIGIGTIQAGTAYNVIAQEAKMEGTIRAFNQSLREATKQRLEALCKQTAALYGGEATLEWQDNTCPLINEEASTAEAQKMIASVLGEENLIRSRRASLGGDDFAEFNLRVPGCYVYVGSGNEKLPGTCRPHHDDHFDIDESSLQIGAMMYAAYAVEYLTQKL